MQIHCFRPNILEKSMDLKLLNRNKTAMRRLNEKQLLSLSQIVTEWFLCCAALCAKHVFIRSTENVDNWITLCVCFVSHALCRFVQGAQCVVFVCIHHHNVT